MTLHCCDFVFYSRKDSGEQNVTRKNYLEHVFLEISGIVLKVKGLNVMLFILGTMSSQKIQGSKCTT